jgi:hypothetical protein
MILMLKMYIWFQHLRPQLPRVGPKILKLGQRNMCMPLWVIATRGNIPNSGKDFETFDF